MCLDHTMGPTVFQFPFILNQYRKGILQIMQNSIKYGNVLVLDMYFKSNTIISIKRKVRGIQFVFYFQLIIISFYPQAILKKKSILTQCCIQASVISLLVVKYLHKSCIHHYAKIFRLNLFFIFTYQSCCEIGN